MSTKTPSEAGFKFPTHYVDTARAVALAGAALLVLSFSAVMYHFVNVVSHPSGFVVLAGTVLLIATTLGRSLRVRTALLVSGALLAAGVLLYLFSLPRNPPLAPLVGDLFALLTGRSLLLVTNVDLWVLGVSPAPLFLTWYFALRRRYVLSTLTGGTTLGFFVLTGDAPAVFVLLGVVGGVVAVGVGDVDRRGESLSVAEPLAVLLAAIVLLSGLVPIVPAGPSGAYESWSSFQSSGGLGSGTLEASLVDAGDELGIAGNISLSPKIRFTVQSSESAYWRIGSYNRYTGTGWVRTGDTDSYRGQLDGPDGPSRSVTQSYRAEDRLGIVPYAWRPVSVNGSVTDNLRVDDTGGVRYTDTITEGTTFSVRSQVPTAGPAQLRNSGRNYPDDIEEKYTKVPSSTPDRVATRTERITANAENPYDTAQVIERWLQNNKDYSLDVERPDSNVADTFLFEREAGYCTYFATTMAVMLRTQGIPARMTVGYTPGERVDSDTWVVRGYNAHAWVEAYFPEIGWIKFDPTPAGPREDFEQSRLDSAREANLSDIDTDETLDEEWTPTPTPTPAPLTERDEAAGTPDGLGGGQTPPGGIADTPPGLAEPGTAADGTLSPTPSNETGAGSGTGGFEWPTREEAALGAITVIGLAVGVRRSGIGPRLYRAVWLRYQPRSDPETDAERAFDRLEYLLERRYRERRPGETPRQYLAAIGADERARQVTLVRERARYAGSVTREEVDEAIANVDDLVSRRKAT